MLRGTKDGLGFMKLKPKDGLGLYLKMTFGREVIIIKLVNRVLDVVASQRQCLVPPAKDLPHQSESADVAQTDPTTLGLDPQQTVSKPCLRKETVSVAAQPSQEQCTPASVEIRPAPQHQISP